jgi:hypothetical protein
MTQPSILIFLPNKNKGQSNEKEELKRGRKGGGG